MRARGTSSSLLMLFRLLRTRFSQLACVREHTHTQKHLASNNTNALVSKKKKTSLKFCRQEQRVRSVGEEEEQVRSDGDQSRQTDLSLAHVGQRLFEMLGRSRWMARGHLAGINKQERKECYSTLADTQQPFYLKNNSIQGPKFNLWAVIQSSRWVRTNSQLGSFPLLSILNDSWSLRFNIM